MAVVACGGDFWVAVTERGGLLVQGRNIDGQLGIGTQIAQAHPCVLGGRGEVEGDEVAALVGGVHALTLAAADAPGAQAALAHPFEDAVAMVSVGEDHAVCVTDGGAVWAWGQNVGGTLAQGNLVLRSTSPLRWPAALCNGSPARMVACGDYHTLVLTRAGEVWACGRGRFGQTGNAQLPRNVYVPERVQGLPRVALVAAGDIFSGAVDEDGQVWMWGHCWNGRLGYLPAPANAVTAAAPTSLGLAAFAEAAVVLLSLRGSRAAAVTVHGALWVWGQDAYGGLGLGDNAARGIPTLVAAGGAPAWGGSSVHMVACGVRHQLVLTADGGVWTCGEGMAGLLGLGDVLDRWVPTRIAPAAFGGAKIVSVEAGSFRSFAVTAEGILYSWGADSMDADTPLQTTPAPVAASLAPGARIGRSCRLPRRHALAFCTGRHARLGAAAPHRAVMSEMMHSVLEHTTRLDGDYAHMGEGLLRLLAVRERQN